MLRDEAKAGSTRPPSARCSPRPATPVPEWTVRSALTDRVVEVLALLSAGLATKQVAGRLNISPKTADRHIQNLYAKIGVSTRAAAALYRSHSRHAQWYAPRTA